MNRVGLALVLVLLASPVGGSTAVGASTQHEPRIVAIYPNPVAEQDTGEFVSIVVPPETALGRYSLADDEAAVSLPNVTAGGRIVLSTAPNRTRRLVDERVLALDDIELANGGEPVVLRRGGEVVDRLRYTAAPEGELRLRNGSDDWRPIGATDKPVVTAGSGTVRAFVLPDSPGVAVDHLRDADDRILLGAYTLTSERVVDALVAASSRQVDVRVLVDGDPVGGISRRQARLLDALVRADVDVRAVGGAHARYNFQHAKYAIADDEALVTTENWKPAGVGGTSSRGWGAITDQHAVVSALADTFAADMDWRGAIPWSAFRSDETFPTANATTGGFPTRFDASAVAVNRTRLLVAPDNAETAVLDALDNASDSLAIEQVSIGGWQSPFLQATLSAARRGVSVRLLLSGAWYTRDENEKLVQRLNERADRQGLPLTARIAAPGDSFEKIHAKGVVVDGDQVILGSLNWNNNSARENREVALVLDGSEAGAYFTRVFDADWPPGSTLPVGYLLAIGIVAVGVVLLVRRLRFGEPTGTDDRRAIQD